ncbi:hypothetical protein BO221_17315 [Archangium sp. Cb G35]|uniref:NACHT domain-containing protein n=1 Tax=Archangium sp. Cb G35 TaxID=1920190 RepID=UPI0009369CFB|nr:hypothetical protein [Archangium sp. Cb G35]OJT23739.1 hypothetical protein BO221_17315 [Archangium sp. Cb G35]
MAPSGRFPLPPVEPRAATLPLQQLTWEDFERLVEAFVDEVLKWQDVHRYGVKGQTQHGIDLYGYMADKTVRTCQVKNVRAFTTGDLRAAVHKFTKGKRPFKSRWLAVAVACPVESTQLLDELHKLKTANKRIRLQVWDQNKFSKMLRPHHTLVRRFFGPEWERVFCEPLPASAPHPHVQDEWQRRLEELLSESRARLVTRWFSAGLEDAQAKAFAADASIGLPQGLSASLPGKGLVLLKGDFGSGKSTAGERLHQRAVERALKEPTAPIPVYLSAREVRGSLKEAVLRAADGLGSPAQQGAHIMLDGIDEPGLQAARDFLEQARLLVRLWPLTRCLLTARPSDLRGHPEEEHVSMPLLTNEEVKALAERIAGVSGWTGWPSSVWETARRPLFTIVAASLNKTPGRFIPRTTAEFLEALVQRALERTGQLENDAQAGLRRLASLTLTSGGTIAQGEYGVDEDIQRLLATRLVVRRGRTLAFTLPIIEQYFGGQALLTGTVKAETIWASLESFDLWHDAVVLAVGSGSWEQVSTLLTGLAGRYPGAAAWVVHKALSENGPVFKEDIENAPALPPGAECARRLHGALTSWVQALGPLGERTRLACPKVESLTLAARTEGRVQLVTSAWRTEKAPTAVRGGELPRDWEWDLPTGALWLYSERVASAEPAWPWMVSLRWLRKEIERVLSAKDLPLRETSPGRAERRWALARTLTGSQDDLLHTPIRADVALTHVRRLLASPDGVNDAGSVQLGDLEDEHPTVQVEELRAFASELMAGRSIGADGLLRRPWTVPDRPDSRSGSISGLYSQEAHLRLVREVYSAALDIYEELVATWLPALHPTLDWACASPIGLKGFLEFDARGDPGLEYCVRPLPSGLKSDVVIEAAPADFDLVGFRRACIEDTAKSLALLRERSPAAVSWFSQGITSTVVYLHGNTPAIDLAYGWLANHLQALSLVSFGYHPPGEY